MMTPERKEEVRKKFEAFGGWFITCCLECKCFQNQGQDFDCDSVIESMNVAIGELLEALDEAKENTGVFMGDAQLAEHNLKLALEVVEAVRPLTTATRAERYRSDHHIANIVDALKRHDEGVT